MMAFRSALFQVWLVGGTAVISFFALPTLFFGEGAARAAIRLWARAMLFGLRILCGVRHRVEGAENLPKDGAIVACNHQSMWETVVFFTLLKKPAAVFKRELARIPVYGWWGKASGSIPIDRDEGARAIRSLSDVAAAKIADGAQVLVFPEGTRVPVGERAPLQPGVAAIYKATGARCVPAAHDSGRFWRHPGWRKAPGVITLRILPAIEGGLDRKTFQKILAERIEAARPDLENAPRAAMAPESAS